MPSLVSIIIPAYNAERWVARAIDSALGQTWKDKEVILVNDGSKDSTLQIASAYQSAIFKVINQENRGLPNARNVGLNHAQGDYIQWLDADDVLDVHKLSIQIDSLRSATKRTISTSALGAFYFRTSKAKFRNSSLTQNLAPINWILNRFLYNDWMQCASYLAPRHLYASAGPCDERLSLDEDGELFTRLIAHSDNVLFAPGAKFFYRVGVPSSMTQERGSRAIDSLLLSLDLSFRTLLAMEDSDRTRYACLQFLSHRRLSYFPNDDRYQAGLRLLAEKLGGTIPPRDGNWKVELAQKLFGQETAWTLKRVSSKVRTRLSRQVDYYMSKLE